MRIKVQSAPPLPPLKAWFGVQSESSILELKRALCHSIQSLHDGNAHADGIILLLDEYELLNTSPANILRDGDTITVKQSAVSRKRGAPDGHKSPPRKKTKTTGYEANIGVAKAQVQGPHQEEDKIAHSISEPDSSHASSTSESSSQISSDIDTSSERDSSESSEPSSSDYSPERIASVRRKIVPSLSRTIELTPKLVPPGHGKSVTHSRNLRRRRKKQYESLVTHSDYADVNSIPLGRKGTARSVTNVSGVPDVEASDAVGESNAPTPPAFMMANLSNKNKRRGFKTAVLCIPEKIVFAQETDDVPDAVAPPRSLISVDRNPLPFSSTQNTELADIAPSLFPRLIHPSEKQELGQLPLNLFVTSVDVEEGRRPPKWKKPKDSVVLNYVEAEETAASHLNVTGTVALSEPAQSYTRSPELTWAGVVKDWTTLAKVQEQSQIVPGTLVGWKELGINSVTYTPEMLLHIGRVADNSEKIIVKLLLDPSTEEISFGGRTDDVDGENVSEKTSQYEWADVIRGDWRVVERRGC